MPFQTHPDSQVTLADCGKMGRPYLPNHPFDGYINAEHRWFAECELDGVCIKAPIPGWLQAADALKLYELAYFTPGDICELGTAFGLSTSIMARALAASGRDAVIETVELDPAVSAQARKNLEACGLAGRITFHTSDAERACRGFLDAGRSFTLAFVDHSHAYWPVFRANMILKDLLVPGGLILFHDYNDPRNVSDKLESDATGVYGVFAAVQDSVAAEGFEFIGSYGCTGLFRKPA